MSAAGAARREAPGRLLDAAVVGVALVVLAVTVPGAGGASAPLLIGVLAAVVLVWLVAGARAVGGGPLWPAVAAVLLAAGLVGTLQSPAFATFQIIAFPLLWLVTPGFRSAVAVNALLAVMVGTGYAVGTSLPAALVTEGLSLALSLAMGTWITRIQTRSTERQRLIDRLTAAQEQLAALHREAGTVAERERLARELHDTLAQSLTGVVMLAERAQARHPDDAALGILHDAARRAMAEARGLVAASAGVPLEGGLAAALQTLAERFRRETGLVVRTSCTASVPRSCEVVLLRCAQEALANVRKHARAEVVTIGVRTAGAATVLTVEDDGLGPGGGEGFGLPGMQDRLALVGGAVELEPGATSGSRLTVRVPSREGADA